MSWDCKRRGPSTGYYYRSVRVPDKPHPIKLYVGRGTPGRLAAALVELRRRDQELARAAVRAEHALTTDADRLAEELLACARLLAEAWLVATGHRNHKGLWRKKRV